MMMQLMRAMADGEGDKEVADEGSNMAAAEGDDDAVDEGDGSWWGQWQLKRMIDEPADEGDDKNVVEFCIN